MRGPCDSRRSGSTALPAMLQLILMILPLIIRGDDAPRRVRRARRANVIDLDNFQADEPTVDEIKGDAIKTSRTVSDAANNDDSVLALIEEDTNFWGRVLMEDASLCDVDKKKKPLGLVLCESERDFDSTWDTLIEDLNNNPNINLFAEVDHEANAEGVVLELGPNRVAVFGNPVLGSPVMLAGRSAGLDLPQKMHVFEGGENGDVVYVGYNPTEYLDARHDVGEAQDQLDTIAGALANLASNAAGTECDVTTSPPIGLGRIKSENGIVTESSKNDFDDTYSRLLQAIDASPATVMFEVDHGGTSNGLLPPTKLVVFGNPNIGTPLMQSSPTAGIDLPVKVLVWTDEEDGDKVKVSYNDPDFLESRHRLCGVDASLDAMRGALENFVGFATTKP